MWIKGRFGIGGIIKRGHVNGIPICSQHPIASHPAYVSEQVLFTQPSGVTFHMNAHFMLLSLYFTEYQSQVQVGFQSPSLQDEGCRQLYLPGAFGGLPYLCCSWSLMSIFVVLPHVYLVVPLMSIWLVPLVNFVNPPINYRPCLFYPSCLFCWAPHIYFCWPTH